MAPPRLTYCGNVHAAGDLDGWLARQREYAVPIAGVRNDEAPAMGFGLGAWWSDPLAAELGRSGPERERVRAQLAQMRLPIWTLNAFPFGDFHATEVKTEVYRPDWSSEERLLYTRNCAEAVADLSAGDDAPLPISTLPLGYDPGDLRVMARNLVRAASHLADLEQRSGMELVLALEPEPFCLLETAAATGDFLEEWVFRPGAWQTVPERVLRRHLGVCVDLCHLAVVHEDPLAALANLDSRGIRVPKIQVSSCLELRDPAELDRLLAFAEPRYLHQTCAEAGGPRALDLNEVAARRQEFERCELLRTHFHVPVYWDEPDGPLGSTRAELQRVLPALRQRDCLLEVETYTWSVLGADWQPDRDLVQGLRHELDFVSGLLASP